MSELEMLAEHVLEKAKRKLEATGELSMMIYVRNVDRTIERYPFPEEFAFLMNSGRIKDIIFGALRVTVQKRGLTAVMFASDGFFGMMTEKGAALPEAEQRELAREHGFPQAVADGYIVRREAIIVSVQTPERARLTTQFYRREDGARQIAFEECTSRDMPIDEFGGRQKMFGDLSPGRLR